MSQHRPRRFTSSRSIGPQKRKVSTGEDSDDGKGVTNIGKNWFFQQTPNSQVYYLKVAVSLVLGLVGLFYGNHLIASNWFIFPTLALIGIYIFVRYYLKYDKETIKDAPLILWHGTISLYIGFIASSVLVWMVAFPPTFAH